MKIDLHMHSNFSACANPDNSWEKLLTLAEDNGLEKISITDHNTCIVHVINKFKDTRNLFKGKIVPGMECDVVEDGLTFELLAYNFDVMKIFNWAYEIYGTLEIRQTKIKNKLVKITQNAGFEIDDTVVFNGKVDYAHKYVLENMQKFEKNKEFFIKYNIETLSDFYRLSTTEKSFPLYMDMNEFWPSVKEVVDAIHNANGVVVLAHPYNYKANVDPNKLLEICQKYKVDGIEVFHPSCNDKQSEYLLNFAKKHNLIITGGSDYHGKPENNVMGLLENQNENEITL